MRNRRSITALLLSALLLLTPVMALGEAAQPTAAPADERTAPQIISQNTSLDLTPFEGKAIYLNFFTKWCPYCMRELPDIKKIYEDYSSDDLQVILVHVWDAETAAESEEIKKDYGLEDMLFFEDEDFALASLVGLQGYPLSLFLDKDGGVHTAMNYAVSYEDIAAVLDEMGVKKAER